MTYHDIPFSDQENAVDEIDEWGLEEDEWGISPE